jgi:hypothetical protein
VEKVSPDQIVIAMILAIVKGILAVPESIEIVVVQDVVTEL